MTYDDDYYSIDLYHAEPDKRMNVFLHSFKIKLAGRKLMQECGPFFNYHNTTKNTLGNEIDPIITKTVEYQQFEMPASRFNDLVEVFCMNRTELGYLREKNERLHRESLLRKKFPSLQKAYEQYQLVLNMIENQK